MVKPESFHIQFLDREDNLSPLQTFYSGQIIRGVVRFRFLRPERSKSLSINFIGTETTYDGPAGSKRTATETDIFKVKINLWNDPCGYFEAKWYAFPFEVDLGQYNFPSSYEGEYANIRYKFKAVIDRPSRFGHSTSAPIILLSSIPTFLPEFAQMETFQASAVFGMVSRETLSLVVDTNLRSCCPGGKLVLDVSLLPHSTKSVTSISFKLMQDVVAANPRGKFKCSYTINQQEIPIAQIVGEDADLIKITVPPTTPPTIDSSQVIDVSYYILVVANVAWSYTPLQVKVPVQISTLNVTLDEIPKLTVGPQYLPPLLQPSDMAVSDLPPNYEGKTSPGSNRASSLPYNPRLSITPSLTSDVSSLYSHESDELSENNFKRQTIMVQPIYTPRNDLDQFKPFTNAPSLGLTGISRNHTSRSSILQ